MKEIKVKKVMSTCIVIAGLIFLMTSYVLYNHLEANELIFEEIVMTNSMYASFGVGLFITIMGTIMLVNVCKKGDLYEKQNNK